MVPVVLIILEVGAPGGKAHCDRSAAAVVASDDHSQMAGSFRFAPPASKQRTDLLASSLRRTASVRPAVWISHISATARYAMHKRYTLHHLNSHSMLAGMHSSATREVHTDDDVVEGLVLDLTDGKDRHGGA